MTHVPLCSTKGCPTRLKSFKGDVNDWHRPWCQDIKGHKCFGGATHQHVPKKGMGGNNPESKIVACICAGAHDRIDNGDWGNEVLDVPDVGKVYRVHDLHGKTLLERVIERCPEEPDPDEGLELRPEIEERLRQSALAVQEPSARDQLAKANAKGRQALELASSVGEAKDIRNRANALRMYAHAAGLGLQAQNEMADIKIRAERKAGQLLSIIEREPGKRKGSTSLQAAIRSAGIDSTMAHRWQLEASLPDLEYEAYAQTCNQEGVELTSAGILRLVRALLREGEESEPPEACPKNPTEGPHEYACKHCGKVR